MYSAKGTRINDMADSRLQGHSMKFTDLIIAINILLFWWTSDWLLVSFLFDFLIIGTFDINLTPDKRTILLHEEQTLIKELSVNSAQS